MEPRSRRTSNLSNKPYTAHTSLPPLTTQRSFLKDDTFMLSRKGKRNNKAISKVKPKQYLALLQNFTDLKVEFLNLEDEKHKLENALLRSEDKYAKLSQEHEQLKEKYSELEHLEDWGRIIREKNAEIRRLNEVLKKLRTDRVEALNEKTTAKAAIGELKCRLKQKRKEVQDVRLMEQTQSKARILSETERYRTERDNAKAKLIEYEILVEKLQVEIQRQRRERDFKGTELQQMRRKYSSKEKQADDLKRNMAVFKMKQAAGKLS
ncbi:predicted protein [Nematostella vectensis]|uniref:Uncharacterized protein n=1 Tax=Nematostella vectensis TaxID=45351 RepID=A7RPA6_NEMVE|nr:predicted protein [Nematostella vectensis]|eukprot:XP_001638714.1 predicted protein [Nematostella vectensis]